MSWSPSIQNKTLQRQLDTVKEEYDYQGTLLPSKINSMKDDNTTLHKLNDLLNQTVHKSPITTQNMIEAHDCAQRERKVAIQSHDKLSHENHGRT